MALKLLAVWGHTPRPWGYEVRVDFADEAEAIHNEVLTFPAEPSASALDAAVAAQQERTAARVAVEALAPVVLPPLPVEVLVARVAELEAQVAAVAVERDAAVEERDAAVAARDTAVEERDAAVAVRDGGGVREAPVDVPLKTEG